jgi:elongator complex protein 2
MGPSRTGTIGVRVGTGTLRVWASGCAPSEATGAELGTAPDAAAAVGGYSAVQTVSFGSGFALAVALATLPNDPSIPVLAVGGDDFFVRLYVFQSTAAESAAGGCGDPPPTSASFGGEFALVAQLPGHQDWIRSLAFATFDSGVLMLASGAQDMFIRLWQIEPRLHQGTATKGDGESEGSRVSDGDGGAAAATPLSTFRRKALEGFDSGFAVSSAKGAARYSVRLDSLLMGHDNWVYSVRWHPRLGDTQPAVLLSASMDRTLMLWTPDPSSGVWIDAARMGETGGTCVNPCIASSSVTLLCLVACASDVVNDQIIILAIICRVSSLFCG